MASRLCCRGSIQDRRSDCGRGIDMKLLWENRRKDAHQSQSDAFSEARFIRSPPMRLGRTMVSDLNPTSSMSRSISPLILG
jgi:hypothetical protein